MKYKIKAVQHYQVIKYYDDLKRKQKYCISSNINK